jgi:predicted dehydrogenase
VAAKVRIGFVGAGFMGQLAHIRSYALLRDECELVALAEPRQRTAELVAARYGIGRVYRDHRELLESEQLDGIVAAQRFMYHAALLPELYPNVPHLFTEKPLALTAAAGDRLAHLAGESGCVHMLGYQRRSDPATVEAKRTVDAWKSSGDMGDLRYLRICYTDGDWTANASARFIDGGERPPPFPAEELPPELVDD